MADASGQALSAVSTTMKVTTDLELMLLNLLKTALALVPDKNLVTVMRKEMELGHVEAEMFNHGDRDEVRKRLAEHGLKEGKDYLFETYRRVDGETYTVLFYNIKDKDTIQGVKNEFEPTDATRRQNEEFLAIMQKAGINPDGTMDVKKFNAFCESKGIHFDFSRPLPEDDRKYAENLISSQFSRLSPNEMNMFAQKCKQTGLLDQMYATRAAGFIRPKTLYDMSKDSAGRPMVNEIKCSEEQLFALEKRAHTYGLRMSQTGPGNDGKYTVFFASKDADTMRRVYADAEYDLTGKAGGLYKEQINFENRYTEQVMNAAIDGTYPDGTKLPDGCMLVTLSVAPLEDGNGNIMKDRDGNEIRGRQTLEFDKNRTYINSDAGKDSPNARTVMSKSNENYKDRLKNAVVKEKPVLLTPQLADAYKKATSEKERMAVLQKAQEEGVHGLEKKPVMTKEDMETIREHERVRELVTKKLQEKLPEYSKMAAYIYSVGSYESYFYDQMINREHSKDEREYYGGGDNFENKAEMESGDLADAFSGEDIRDADRQASEISESMSMFDDMENCAAHFQAVMHFDAMTGGNYSQDECEEICSDMASDIGQEDIAQSMETYDMARDFE